MSDGNGGRAEVVTSVDLAAVAELADAAHEVADFLNGVVGLAGGALGGEAAGPAAGRFGWRDLLVFVPLVSWFRRTPPGSVAEGLAGSFGPEQLRKAANAADRMVAALDRLRPTPACAPLVAELDDLGVPTMPADIWATSVRSPELVALNRRLAAARGAIAQATGRLTLQHLRSNQEG